MTVSTPARPQIAVRGAISAVRPTVGRAGRWRGAFVAAWVVGAIGGVVPTAFLGEPAAGLAGAAALGLVAVALAAPVLVAPLVASVVCDDDQHQVSTAWHGIGVGPGRRMLARSAAAARSSLRLLPVGALAGSVAGLGLAGWGPDPFLLGFDGGPAPAAAGVAMLVLVVSWVLGGLVAAWAASTARALLVLLVSALATGAVAGLVYFVPSMQTLFWLTPWAALWPFDPQSFNSAQFAASVPVVVRLGSGGAWLLLLALAAAVRRRRVPYPMPGEQGRARLAIAPAPVARPPSQTALLVDLALLDRDLVRVHRPPVPALAP